MSLETQEKKKKELPGTFVLTRMGDFYEVLGLDAEAFAKLAFITLTKRDGMAMCGLPYHAVVSQAFSVAAKGFSVRICGADSRIDQCEVCEEFKTDIVVEAFTQKVFCFGCITTRNREKTLYHTFRQHKTDDSSNLKSCMGSVWAATEAEALELVVRFCGKPITGFEYTATRCGCRGNSFSGIPLKACYPLN